MPAPRPLTLCPPARLDWSRPGTPAAAEFGDIYFSTDGGLEETRAVFLGGCGLPEGWHKTERFVIGELGFGSGLNFLATWQMWEKNKPDNAHLHFISVEKFPLDTSQLEKALSAWPELSTKAKALLKAWPDRIKGLHRLHFGNVTLTLIHDDILPALESANFRANAWFLDGFSPSKNPEMWSSEVMKKVADLSAPGARMATFTVAGSVRRALTEAGFDVERKDGFGRKRHRLEARHAGTAKYFKYDMKNQPTIIGAGIGGLSLARAFLRRGIVPKVIEDPDHIAASGNAAALIKPRFDLQDRPESRFFLSSYLYALEFYKDYSLSYGITHLAKNESEIERHKKLLSQQPLPKTHMEAAKNHALFLGQALAIDPLAHRQSVLDQADYETQKLENLSNISSPVFLAAGYGIRTLLPDWPLRFSRGQLSWAEDEKAFSETVSYGGYALPVRDKILIGATHDRLTPGENPFDLRPEDDQKNLDLYETYIGLKPTPSDKSSRASVRVTTPDTLPAIGKTQNDIQVLTGLGSRGFVFAPLLAEAIISKYLGDPLPIEKEVWQKFSASRLFS
ncbi:tRNA (5-methylaminomethyl-2-thiouridine)(34)-methyltransferase MnmD [Litorimonas sp.]|uniref:tRNA (5-methylaminomethyl-2-thiouridine)(34)-methyltransferase MnmD n=1 Tax=Litorimonas sp. TaxID=1892381 RepID=UPI003A8B2B48